MSSKRKKKPLSAKLISMWHPTMNGNLRPEDVSGGSKLTVWFLHYDDKWKQWHEWPAKPNNMGQRKNCSICSGHRIVVGINDLATRNPTVAAMWHPTLNGELTAQMVVEHSNEMRWWQHKDKITGILHEWPMAIGELTRKKPSKCSICSGDRIQVGVNDLATTHSVLTSEWHPTFNGTLTPQMVTKGSNIDIWWQKECLGVRHEWHARLADRTSKKPQGCAICNGQQVQIGVNDLATTHPDLALEWHPTLNGSLTPQMVTKGSRKEIWWQKDCFKNGIYHEWHAIPKARTGKRPQGCAICRGLQIQLRVNDLASQRPDLALEWDKVKNKKLTPQMVTVGSNQKVFWKHKALNGPKHGWPATVAKRTRPTAPTGCPESECSKTGFDPSKPAHLYILSATINKIPIIQFGISNTVQARLVAHVRSGFTDAPVRLISFHNGANARATELSLLHLMRDYNILSCFSQGIKFSGSTEAFCLEDADENFLEEFKELVGF